MRTFVAVDLDPRIKDILSDFINILSSKKADVRWAKKQGMHITLKFLGEVPESEVQNIIRSLRKACDAHEPSQLTFKGTGCFPPRSSWPRILWAGIEPSQDLSVLHKRIEDELGKLGFPREKRRFHPHLTLGRVKSNSNINTVLDVLHDQREKHFGHMRLQRVTLFKSLLKPSGAEYEVLSDIEIV